MNACVRAKSFQLRPTLCDPMDYIAHQAPLSMGFSRQEYWCGLPCPLPGDLLRSGTEPLSLVFPALTGGFFTTSTTGKPTQVNRGPQSNLSKRRLPEERKVGQETGGKVKVSSETAKQILLGGCWPGPIRKHAVHRRGILQREFLGWQWCRLSHQAAVPKRRGPVPNLKEYKHSLSAGSHKCKRRSHNTHTRAHTQNEKKGQ